VPLVANIVLGLTASEAVTMVSLRVFQIAAFVISGIRGGLTFKLTVTTDEESRPQ